jgi:glucose/arabinose dehydrogenase
MSREVSSARTVAAALALACLGLACAHAKTTDTDHPKPADKEAPAAEKRASQPPAKEKEAARPATAIPVAGAAEGLLEPDAQQQIHDKLAAGGFLGEGEGGDDSQASMREGLRRFQRAHDLPATGAPDHETVHKLGLDPNKIFRRAERH